MKYSPVVISRKSNTCFKDLAFSGVPHFETPFQSIQGLGYVLLKPIYCMYIPLSDDEHRFVQKVHTARANGHCLCGWNNNPLLLRYHIQQLYFVCNHLIVHFSVAGIGDAAAGAHFTNSGGSRWGALPAHPPPTHGTQLFHFR